MAVLPRAFIRQVLVAEIRDVIPHHPYLVFPLIGIGIEYLGRALDTRVQNWDHDYRGSAYEPFDEAITHLFPQRYHTKRLRDRMRNGLLHFYAPKAPLALARLDDRGVRRGIAPQNHPYMDSKGNVTLVVEYFFADFVSACDQIIYRHFSRADKMSRRFIRTDLSVSR